MPIDLIPLIDEGLGNSAYLVDLGDGRALAVDVSHAASLLEAAGRHDLAVLDGGPHDWVRAAGGRLESGS